MSDKELNSSSANPILRDLEIEPVQHEGHTYIQLRDPLELTDDVLYIPQPLAIALTFCDGENSVADIQQAFAEQFQIQVETQQLDELLQALDNALMLDNEQSQQALEGVQASYQSESCRAPVFAGRGYPADPNELRRYLDQFIDVATKEYGVASELDGSAIRGLLSPHIDYVRGGPVYGSVWHHAAEALEDIDLVVILATDHYGRDPFTLTRQNYATPYGSLPTAINIVDKLALAIDDVQGKGASFRGELRHLREHSIELVAVWLHHMLEKQEREPAYSCEIVPILCGGLHRHIMGGSNPADDPVLQGVLDVLHEVSAERKVLIVASGDLAHVGPAFSGSPLNTQRRTVLRHADDALMHSMNQGDSDAFFDLIRGVEDRNNVCGVTPIYLTMRLLSALTGFENPSTTDVSASIEEENLAGTTVAYDTCPADERNTSVVTIGGVLFS